MKIVGVDSHKIYLTSRNGPDGPVLLSTQNSLILLDDQKDTLKYFNLNDGVNMIMLDFQFVLVLWFC